MTKLHSRTQRARSRNPPEPDPASTPQTRRIHRQPPPSASHHRVPRIEANAAALVGQGRALACLRSPVEPSRGCRFNPVVRSRGAVGVGVRVRPIFGAVDLPVRMSISTCIGCGSMREFAKCEGICRERKLELVSGGEYDELVAAATASRSRIGLFLPIVADLAGAAPLRPNWRVLCESFRERARLVLRAAGAPGHPAFDDAAPSAETTIVWRCPDCGGLEAMQPCIGVCIWRPADWVQAAAFESDRAQALRDIHLERSLFGLLTRVANVAPRDDEWRRNALAFQAQAREIVDREVG